MRVHTRGVRATFRVVLAVALLLVLAGCRVDATVDVEVTDDGSGTVSIEAVFDDEASQALGGIEGIAEQLFVSDLAAAGWAVTQPEVGADTDVLAEHDGHPVLCRQGNVLVASFHPELSTDRRLHELFCSIQPG